MKKAKALEWIVPCRVTLRGHAIVIAGDAEGAAAGFDAGDFEYDYTTGETVDWERTGKAESNE